MAATPSPQPHPASSQSSSPSPALLQLWFALLVAVGLLACGRALLLPPWPRAHPIHPARLESALRQAGLNPQSLSRHPPFRTERLAVSQRLVWRLADGVELSLASVAVRRWPDFQVALFTKDIPALFLQKRRLDVPLAGVASGSIQGRQALQSCLVSQPTQPAIAAVTVHFLNQAVNRQVSTLSDRIGSLIGFGKPRQLRCLLVTLRGATVDPPPASLWRQVTTALQGLESPSP